MNTASNVQAAHGRTTLGGIVTEVFVVMVVAEVVGLTRAVNFPKIVVTNGDRISLIFMWDCNCPSVLVLHPGI